MIVYKIRDNKIVGISTKDENYQIKEGEFGSDTWYQKPFWNGSEVIETITQEEIDAQNAEQIKQDNINAYRNLDSTLGILKTPNGLEDWAVTLGNDGKLSTIKIN